MVHYQSISVIIINLRQLHHFDKMKLIVVATCILAAALAAPNVAVVDPELAALRARPALDHEEVHDELGQYKLHYRTAEGTEVTESGKLVPALDGNTLVLVVEGETKYIGTDGKLYITKYTAGLNGTHVEGVHLPVPVVAEPVPEIVVPEVLL